MHLIIKPLHILIFLILSGISTANLIAAVSCTGHFVPTHNNSTNGISSPRDSVNNSQIFYDSIKSKASKNKVTQKIYELLFRENGDSIKTAYTVKSDAEYAKYKEKIIRDIYFKKIDFFAASIDNPNGNHQNWVERTSKQFHEETNSKIISQNLFIKEGDVVVPSYIADNEMYLRRLPFIKDARIHIINARKDSKYVDLLVITQDVWSKGFYAELTGTKTGRLEIYDRNISGLGHQTQGNILFDYDKYPVSGYEEFYAIENIGGTFIKGQVNYYNAFRNESYGIGFSRDFVTPKFKYAGGIKLERINEITDIKEIDTIFTNIPLKYLYQDYWMGRSLKLNALFPQLSSRPIIVLAGRVIKNQYGVRPTVNPDYNYRFYNKTLYLASLAFSRQRFYKSSLIYSFGKTEDIPYGSLVKFTIGKEYNEFQTRNYSGVLFAMGGFHKKLGYAYTSFSLGGFYNKKEFEQGVLDLQANFFSKIIHVGSYRVRQFVNLKYTLGLDRYDDERIYLEKYGVRGLKGDVLQGMQRLVVNIETVSFTQFNPLNFRFALFGFTDIGFIGPNNQSIFKTDFYPGFGIGVRIKNDNLVFETFQVRLGFYPVVPTGATSEMFKASGKSSMKFNNFNVQAPDIINFE